MLQKREEDRFAKKHQDLLEQKAAPQPVSFIFVFWDGCHLMKLYCNPKSRYSVGTVAEVLEVEDFQTPTVKS